MSNQINGYYLNHYSPPGFQKAILESTYYPLFVFMTLLGIARSQKLLVNHCFVIYLPDVQVRNFQLTEVSRTEFMTPSAFIFLYELQLFLTFRNRSVAVWNFRGELVTSFEDHLLWHPDCNTNNIYITSDQDLIISYCKADSDDSSSDSVARGNGNTLYFCDVYLIRPYVSSFICQVGQRVLI